MNKEIEYLYTNEVPKEFTFYYGDYLYRLFVLDDGARFRVYNPETHKSLSAESSALFRSEKLANVLIGKFPEPVVNWIKKIMNGVRLTKERNSLDMFRSNYDLYEPVEYYSVIGKITAWLNQQGSVVGIVLPGTLIVTRENPNSNLERSLVKNIDGGNFWEYLQFRMKEKKKTEFKKIVE